MKALVGISEVRTNNRGFFIF